MSVQRFARNVKPGEMFRRRRARKVAPGVYSVIGRDGRTRYSVEVDGDFVSCDCPAGQHGRACYHSATVLRRLRNEYQRGEHGVRRLAVAS